MSSSRFSNSAAVIHPHHSGAGYQSEFAGDVMSDRAGMAELTGSGLDDSQSTIYSLLHSAGNPNGDPNGSADYQRDYQTWQNYGGFFINSAGANGQEIGTWTTNNPGGTGGGGSPPATPLVISPDASPSAYHNVEFDVGVCSLYIAGGVIGGSPGGPAGAFGGGLIGTAACAQQIKGDWDNVSAVAKDILAAMQNLASDFSNDASNEDSGADGANALFEGSSMTGSELITTPDGLVWRGNDTGGFGQGDSFSSTSGPPVIVRYDDLPFVVVHH